MAKGKPPVEQTHMYSFRMTKAMFRQMTEYSRKNTTWEEPYNWSAEIREFIEKRMKNI